MKNSLVMEWNQICLPSINFTKSWLFRLKRHPIAPFYFLNDTIMKLCRKKCLFWNWYQAKKSQKMHKQLVPGYPSGYWNFPAGKKCTGYPGSQESGNPGLQRLVSALSEKQTNFWERSTSLHHWWQRRAAGTCESSRIWTEKILENFSQNLEIVNLQI